MKKEIIKNALSILGHFLQIISIFLLGTKKDFKSCDLLRSFSYIGIITYFLLISSPEFFLQETTPQEDQLQHFHNSGLNLLHL